MSRSFHFGELNRINTASSKLAVVFTIYYSANIFNFVNDFFIPWFFPLLRIITLPINNVYIILQI